MIENKEFLFEGEINEKTPEWFKEDIKKGHITLILEDKKDYDGDPIELYNVASIITKDGIEIIKKGTYVRKIEEYLYVFKINTEE